MIISGIVMACRRGRREALEAEVSGLPWAEPHFSDGSGRLVVTIEADSIEESMDRLKILQALPSAVMAELAQYCIEQPEDDRADTLPEEPGRQT